LRGINGFDPFFPPDFSHPLEVGDLVVVGVVVIGILARVLDVDLDPVMDPAELLRRARVPFARPYSIATRHSGAALAATV